MTVLEPEFGFKLKGDLPTECTVEQACRPLAYALDDVGVRCERLEAALKESVARHPDLSEA